VLSFAQETTGVHWSRREFARFNGVYGDIGGVAVGRVSLPAQSSRVSLDEAV